MEQLTLDEVYKESSGASSSPFVSVTAYLGYPYSILDIRKGDCDENSSSVWELSRITRKAQLIRQAITRYDKEIIG